MTKRIKALLVGVTQYDNSVDSQRGDVETSLPSAALDVGAMAALLNSLRKPGVQDVEVECLLHGNDIRKKSILAAITRLCANAGDGEGQDNQLVFYFSGHGMLVKKPSGDCEELLCPADVQWGTAENAIVFKDFLDIVGPALVDGACIEVILEACSATTFVPAHSHHRKGISLSQRVANAAHIQRFGCFFGGRGAPAGAGAVWNASKHQMPSYSGPVPACSNTPARGLFTHFFCQNFGGKTRLELLTAVHKDLQAYWMNRNGLFGRNGCCDDDRMKLPQIPTLFMVNTSGSANDVQVTLTPPKEAASLPFGPDEDDKDALIPVGGGMPMSGGCSRLTGDGSCGPEIDVIEIIHALEAMNTRRSRTGITRVPVAITHRKGSPDGPP